MCCDYRLSFYFRECLNLNKNKPNSHFLTKIILKHLETYWPDFHSQLYFNVFLALKSVAGFKQQTLLIPTLKRDVEMFAVVKFVQNA